MKSLIGLASCLALTLALTLGGSDTAIADQIYDANSDFKAFELANSGTQSGAFFTPNWSAGYGLSLGDFTAFAPANHTDAWLFNPAVQGWYIANTYSIPAVVVNTSTSAESVAGTTLDPSQILMHPGGLDGFGGMPPFYNAVLRMQVITQ
jgi:hypothetical protein